MPGPIFNTVKKQRDEINTELQNSKNYLAKAIEEKRLVQLKVDALQSKLDVFDAWLLANP